LRDQKIATHLICEDCEGGRAENGTRSECPGHQKRGGRMPCARGGEEGLSEYLGRKQSEGARRERRSRIRRGTKRGQREGEPRIWGETPEHRLELGRHRRKRGRRKRNQRKRGGRRDCPSRVCIIGKKMNDITPNLN